MKVKLRSFGEHGEIVRGSQVRVVGLKSRSDLNGRVGRVVSWEPKKQPPRYGVAIDGETGTLGVKEENLRLLTAVDAS